jgi:hypothetical protein
VGRGKVQAVAALPELIKNGIHLEAGKPDDKGRIRHIFAAKLNMGTEPLVVGFVVQEDRNGKKYYNHELTEIENLGSLARPEERASNPEASRDSVMNIVRKHLGVNPDLTLNSSGPGGKLRGQDKGNLGYTRFTSDAYRIVLGKNANLSTLLYFFVGHERSRNESDPTIWATERFVGIFVGIEKMCIN